MGRSPGRGWARVLALTGVVIAFSVVQPALLVFVPFGLLALGLGPRRPVTVAAGALMLGAALAGTSPEGLAAIERGWALLAGAWFLLAVAVLPEAGFVTRGLVALGGAGGSAVALLALRSGGLSRVDAAFTERLRETTSRAAEAWSSADVGLAADLGTAMQRAAEIQVLLYPALLGLATLAGLGVAWWGWNRLALQGERGLGPLREFRFSDALVWLLILGVVLVLLPRTPDTMRAGSNLLAFMGALYALRGLGVLLFMSGSPGPLVIALGAVALVLLYPLVVATTFLVGLFDTWLDIRKRRAAAGGTET